MIESKKINFQNGIIVVLLIAVLAGIFLLRLRMLSVPLERDEGEYAYIGQLILQGVPPYSEAYTMKLPGVSIMYAVIFFFMGETIEAIHLGLAIVNCCSMILIFVISRRLNGSFPAIAATMFYGLLTLTARVLGFAAHATHFVVLFVLLGIMLLLMALESRKNYYHLFFSGLCFGAAIVMKQHGAIFALFALFAFIFTDLKSKQNSLSNTFQKCLVLSAGIILPFISIVMWTFLAGTFSNFWFWTFTYASVYTSYEVPLRDGIENLYFAFHSVIGVSPLAWKIALFGIPTTFLFRRENEKPWFIFFFFIASFISILPGFYFREHYFVTLMPAIAIYIGFGFQRTAEIFKRIGFLGKLKWLPASVTAFLFLVAVSEKLKLENDYLFHRSPNEISIHIYGPNSCVETMFIADSIRAHSKITDRIAVLGSEPQIFFYSHRRSATGFIYFYPIMELQKYADVMQKRVITDIETTKPEYILYTAITYLLRITPESGHLIFNWLPHYLEMNYDLVDIVDIKANEERSKSYWGEEAQTHVIQNQYCLKLYKKKVHEVQQKNK